MFEAGGLHCSFAVASCSVLADLYIVIRESDGHHFLLSSKPIQTKFQQERSSAASFVVAATYIAVRRIRFRTIQ